MDAVDMLIACALGQACDREPKDIAVTILGTDGWVPSSTETLLPSDRGLEGVVPWVTDPAPSWGD